jgi:hypothetical protein
MRHQSPHAIALIVVELILPNQVIENDVNTETVLFVNK